MTSSTDVEQAVTRRVPGQFTGQATQVEQSRAIAEVQAMVIIAQQCPRNVPSAVSQMRESCGQKALADMAFYRYPRGGQTVTGASIHLARELARVWGNITYGIAELRRDDTENYSEMQAFAWDLQTNARATQAFVVPHKRDKKDKTVEVLTDMRDIYETTANMGARRVREQIFAILPPWFVDEAKTLCNNTLTKGADGKTLPQQIAAAVKAYEAIGVTATQIETKFGGRKSDKWTPHDLAQLRIILQSIQRGEVSREDEFPHERITLSEVEAEVGQ